MSALNGLLSAIRTRGTSDTGTGGLFDSSGTPLTGWYSILGPQESATLPYVVVFPVSQTRDNAFDSTDFADLIYIQMSLFTEGLSDYSVDQAFVDRLLVRFDRWAPTVADYTPSQLIHDGVNVIQEDNNIRHHALDFRCLLAKT